MTLSSRRRQFNLIAGVALEKFEISGKEEVSGVRLSLVTKWT